MSDKEESDEDESDEDEVLIPERRSGRITRPSIRLIDNDVDWSSEDDFDWARPVDVDDKWKMMQHRFS